LAISKEERRRREAEHKRQMRKENPEHYREIQKKSRERNLDACRARSRDYHQKHKERLSKYHKQWQKDNREHARFKKVLRNFGLSSDKYQQIMEEQNNLCAICRKPETRRDKRTGHIMRLSVDHDHRNGVVRGLLCGACNAALGHFDDDCDRLRSAINYILDYRRRGVLKIA
jgi:hypothetical protein